MNRPVRHLRWTAAVLLATGLVAGCAGPQTDSPGAGGDGGSISIVMYQKPKLFSPIEPAHGPDQQVMSLIYQSLMTPSPDLELVPQLAEDVKVNDDATEFTFTLKKDLKWSDGKPFTSADVLFTHQTLANPKSTSPASGSYRGIVGAADVVAGTADTVSGMTAPDESTFVIRTEAPNYGILAQVAIAMILPKHILGDKPIDTLAKDPFFANPTVGLGPFQFVKYEVDQYVELKKNPNFHTEVGIDKVFLKPVTADVATAQLGTGEMDIAPVTPTDKPTLEGFGTLNFASSKEGGFVRVGLNLTQERFKNVKVRQGLLTGIDRKAIVDSALPGVGVVRNSSFDPSVSGDDIDQYEYNPERAKQLLTEGGWDFNQTVKLAWIPASNPDRDAAAIAIESQLNEIGVKVELQQVDAGWTTDAFDGPNFDMFMFGGGNYAVDSWNVNAIVSCDTQYPNGGNTVRFCNPELDAKIKQANTTADPEERLKVYGEAAKIDNEQVPYLWLYSPGGLWAVNNKLENFKPLTPTGGGFWKAEDWRLAS
jgi:peptide/nickel transport system substrate-binding protein